MENYNYDAHNFNQSDNMYACLIFILIVKKIPGRKKKN